LKTPKLTKEWGLPLETDEKWRYFCGGTTGGERKSLHAAKLSEGGEKSKESGGKRGLKLFPIQGKNRKPPQTQNPGRASQSKKKSR